jgi:hypothetical protein
VLQQVHYYYIFRDFDCYIQKLVFKKYVQNRIVTGAAQKWWCCDPRVILL